MTHNFTSVWSPKTLSSSCAIISDLQLRPKRFKAITFLGTKGTLQFIIDAFRPERGEARGQRELYCPSATWIHCSRWWLIERDTTYASPATELPENFWLMLTRRPFHCSSVHNPSNVTEGANFEAPYYVLNFFFWQKVRIIDVIHYSVFSDPYYLRYSLIETLWSALLFWESRSRRGNAKISADAKANLLRTFILFSRQWICLFLERNRNIPAFLSQQAAFYPRHQRVLGALGSECDPDYQNIYKHDPSISGRQKLTHERQVL